MYLLVAVEATSLSRKWLPKRLWRVVHTSSFAMFLLGTGHSLMAGLVAFMFLLVYRLLTRSAPALGTAGA